MSLGRKVWLLLLVTTLVSVLLPVTLLAQGEKTDLWLRVRPETYNRKVKPGETSAWFLEVHNSGNRALTNIRLSAEKPEGWVVEFSPEVIPSLTTGSLETVDVKVKPPSNAYRGTQDVTLIAEANETRRVITVYFNVQSTTTVWLWVGVGIGVAVVVAMIIVFLRFGRD